LWPKENSYYTYFANAISFAVHIKDSCEMTRTRFAIRITSVAHDTSVTEFALESFLADAIPGFLHHSYAMYRLKVIHKICVTVSV